MENYYKTLTNAGLIRDLVNNLDLSDTDDSDKFWHHYNTISC